ncbi:bifunctional aminoglycoside phosphotransferase/ATP-binding protein [Arundinibacter roseus]|uniref:Aminoglycoside phosphotransferase n=1 Tax=Arundinibacter roseus TaxID=2070510 RepID=A0A4R4K2Y9_9BACT|nr:AAA family ATPase [Arundinibacter roseus]TDB60399.1 hypothetical protein EZE20_20930 [Arundinibacter roseus]
MNDPSLSDRIDFLTNPSSFSEPTATVEIRQTHISVVALTDRYVYKLKKPVLFDFLDFSTLEKRLYYCEEEIRLNRRLSPQLYVGLLPLYFANGQLSFEPGGRLVDYVIQMHRLPEEGMLVHQIRQDDFPLHRLDNIAARLLDFYQTQLSKPELTPYGNHSHIRHTIEDVFHGFELRPTPAQSAPIPQVIKKYLFDFLDQHAILFAQREQQHRIVEGHGDLRTEHIHTTWAEEINVYDCLEFDKKLRTVDWLNDVAFLLMDLDYRHRNDLSRRLETTWLSALETEPVTNLLTFYKTYRACVRAKINGLTSVEEEVPAAKREESRQKAYGYYQLALRYAVLGAGPTVLLCMGGVASGKSTLAARLAQWFNCQHLNSDQIRKQQAGLDPLTRLPDHLRAKLYTPENTQHVYEALWQQARQQIDKQGLVVLDATFRQQEYLQTLVANCHTHGICLLILHTTAPEAVVLTRLKKRETEPGVSDMRLSDYSPEIFQVGYEPDSLAPQVLTVSTERPPEDLLLQTVLPWFRELNN